MTNRKTFTAPAIQAPAIGSTIARPRMLGVDGATRGTVAAVQGGNITILWTDGRKTVCPAAIVTTPGWKVAA